MKTATVIGGGFAGCTWARMLAEKRWKVTLIEQAPMLGGGCQTLYWGGHPYTYGPRHLFTAHEHVYAYIDKFLPQRRLNHYLLTYVERDGAFYSYPIHAADVARMPDRATIDVELRSRPDPATARNFEEYWVYSVGRTLYEKFVKTYSEKMWQIESNTVLTDFKFDGKGVNLRTDTHEVRPEFFISYPIKLNGWDDWFEQTAAMPEVEVRLSTRIEAYDVERAAVRIKGEWLRSDILVSSTSPDLLCDNQYGELHYIGRDFMTLVLPVEQVIPDPVFFLHYANSEQFTRVVEYKKLTGYKAPTTLLGIEIPSKRNKLYPYPIKEEQDRADRYLTALPKHVFSVGRMGNYRYYDIGMIVDEALRRIKDL